MFQPLLGDSGGGLFAKDSVAGEEKYIQVGIVSYGDGCGKLGMPRFVLFIYIIENLLVTILDFIDFLK